MAAAAKLSRQVHIHLTRDRSQQSFNHLFFLRCHEIIFSSLSVIPTQIEAPPLNPRLFEVF